MATVPAAPHGRRLAPWLVLAVGVACMLPGLGNSFTYDDLPLVRDNPRLTNLCDFRAVWLSNWWAAPGESRDQNAIRDPLYRPFTIFTLALNYATTGLRPVGFHATNIALHALACLLVYWFARRLTGDATLALIAGLLFAVHPVHVEAIANIVGRAEMLVCIWLLAAMLLLMPRAGRPGLGRTALAALCCLLGLLSKESAISYPVIAVLVLWWTGVAVREWRWWLPRLVVLALPLAIYFPLRYIALDGRLWRTAPQGLVMNPLVRTEGLDRIIGAFTVLGHYARLTFLPTQLSCDYGYAVVNPAAGVTTIAVLGVTAALMLLVALAGLITRRTSYRLAGVLSICFVASYFLISNAYLLIGVTVAERLFYWPSVTALLLVALAIAGIWRRYFLPGAPAAARARLVRILGIALLATLGLRSALRTLDWSDNFTLAKQDVQTFPQSSKLNIGYARALLKQVPHTADAQTRAALLAEATRYARRALAIEPRDAENLIVCAYAAAEQGNTQAAEAYVATALQLQPSNSEALRLDDLLRGSSAEVANLLAGYEQQLTTRPADATLEFEYATELMRHGQPYSALPHAEHAVALRPDWHEARRLLGEALASTGDSAQGRAVLAAVVHDYPDDWRAHTNLSSLLASIDAPAALRHAQRAYELNPDDVRVCRNMAAAYVVNDDPAQARRIYESLLRRLPVTDPFRELIRADLRTLGE